MDRIADAVPYPGDRAEGIRPRPQMGDGAEELEGMPFLFQRIGLGIGNAIDEGCFWRGSRWPVPCPARPGLRPRRGARADGKLFDFRLVVRQRGLGDDLDVAEAGAVVQFEEAEARLSIAPRTDPTLNNDILADRFGLAGSGNGDF